MFTVKEVEQFLKKHYSGNVHTRKALLTYYRNRGRIIPLRRGLYAVIPVGSDPATYAVDPFLIAAKLADDAVLAYHTALEYYGKAYSTYRRYTYTTLTKSAPFHFKSNRFLCVPVPKPLRERQNPTWGEESFKRDGITFCNSIVPSICSTRAEINSNPNVSGWTSSVNPQST